ncbi:MAG: hypothetical protein IIB73_02525 [Proteobacteria bacterium]|nr:hypothetical protein [Pseudomonadota bacterium]
MKNIKQKRSKSKRLGEPEMRGLPSLFKRGYGVQSGLDPVFGAVGVDGDK